MDIPVKIWSEIFLPFFPPAHARWYHWGCFNIPKRFFEDSELSKRKCQEDVLKPSSSAVTGAVHRHSSVSKAGLGVPMCWLQKRMECVWGWVMVVVGTGLGSWRVTHEVAQGPLLWRAPPLFQCSPTTILKFRVSLNKALPLHFALSPCFVAGPG